MAQLEVPPAAVEPRPNGRHEPAAAPPPRWSGDDAVPRGLAVTSAVTLRVIIVVGGIVLLALFAKRMMVVVIPVIIALLLATLLSPLARWLQRKGTPPALAAALAVGLAFVIFLGLWGLVIPPFVTQVPDVVENVQQGAGQIGDAAAPLGLSDSEVQDAIRKARDQLEGGQVAGKLLSGAMLIVQWAAAIILIVVLTFFFIKDGSQLRDWTVCLFAEHRRETLREISERAWGALATYVQGVFLVATLDAVLIGIVLVLVGVPIALPLIVLTFLAAFFPIVGAVMAGAAATLVALVSGGVVDAAIVLGAIIAIQQLEGNVFYPMVVGKQLKLHPVAILLALTAGGVLAGVAGAFLAIPVAAVVSAVLDYMRTRRRHDGPEVLVTP
ncbi:MAG TPA: AI-2E family transporter [Solirubrobacteraceae bacterium]|nr:AI-2E family transporter [Solirubrobacteraceae bacterium]